MNIYWKIWCIDKAARALYRKKLVKTVYSLWPRHLIIVFISHCESWSKITSDITEENNQLSISSSRNFNFLSPWSYMLFFENNKSLKFLDCHLIVFCLFNVIIKCKFAINVQGVLLFGNNTNDRSCENLKWSKYR